MRVLPGRHEKYKLLAFCSSESALFCLSRLKDSNAWNKISHTVFMAVVPDIKSIASNGHEEFWLERDIPAVGSIYRLHPTGPNDPDAILRSRQLGETVDFSTLREWLSFCRTRHRCISKPLNSRGAITRAFRVIDCTKDPPAVEEHPWGIPYAALSYVWGNDSKEEWPRTVLDSVAVTKEMELQYLWVDRLCIDQTNPTEKHYLISKMGTIYERAEVTIIAAAGSGATYGLPGVRSTPRKPQSKVELSDGSILVSTLQNPRGEILRSDYSTRGWTYQEGILSNRRLVFTDHQVYWECRCMAVHESICLPLHLVHEGIGIHMADFMLAGIFRGNSVTQGVTSDTEILACDPKKLGYGFDTHREASHEAKLRALDEHIRTFSARKLSYDSDSLVAFSGIVGLYKSKQDLHLYLGIPVWSGRILRGRPGILITFAMSVCSWYHRSSPGHRIFMVEPSRRRTHMPSWTWAGWDGTVTWRAPPADEHSMFMADLIQMKNLKLVWAADIYLQGISLSEANSAEYLDGENLKLLKVENPFILKYFNLRKTKKEWRWERIGGRHGQQQYHAGRMDWDDEWRRLAGRLAFIGLSVPMTMEEWTAKHFSGDIISVLMFAGPVPSQSWHGRARFLTLREAQIRSPVDTPIWERIGVLQLIVHEKELSKFITTKDMLGKLPVHQQGRDIIIQ